MGAFTSAALMGGGKVLIMPILIQQLIIQRAEYGKGAALSTLLLVFVFSINLAAGWWFSRKRKRELLAPRAAT
jgi:putative spermidine/putrescine transport system permease protein